MRSGSAASAAFAGFALLASGCYVNFDETTFVRVRDPSKVAVGVREEKGGAWLLGAGAEGRVEVPPEAPPFTEKILYAEVQRGASGGTTLSCPSCEGATRAVVVPDAGAVAGAGAVAVAVPVPIALEGDPAATLVRSPDTLAMRYTHDALFPCRRGHGKCTRPALALWLSTPASNVVAIRYRKRVVTDHGERTGAWLGTITGAAFALLGLGLGTGITAADGPNAPTFLVSGGFVGLGSFFFFEGLAGLRAKDSEVILSPDAR